ncbi:MAG: hypothetical protein J1F27_05480 [Prevotellaceae bacterium]|nr:hypothetical protein [Prevotellaceae bacterium]
MSHRQPQLRHRTMFPSGLIVAILFAAMSCCPVQVAGQSRKKEVHTSRYYANRALGFESANSWEAAKREIDAGLEYYPDDPDLRYLNGRYYFHAHGDLQQARYNLVKALQENDQHFQARRLMVDVEEEAGHYSSAICYINELLEFEPYDRDLWRRKIYLYNQQGNKTEADQTLERLSRIFPNDTIIRRDQSMRNREIWNHMVQTTTPRETAANLEHYIELDPTNMDYYLKLIDIYRFLGEEEQAFGTVSMALRQFPYNTDLVRLGSRILAGMNEYTRALNFLRENRVSGALYDNMLQEVADDNRLKDPYEANGRLYARTHNRNALAYMLNTSLTRGYYEDAKYYLSESMKVYGVTPELLMKEYALEKRFGNEAAQMRLLQKLYETNPEDDDLKEQYADMMLVLVGKDMEAEQWSDALAHIERALEILTPESESWPSTISRQIIAYGRLGEMNAARQVYVKGASLQPDSRARFAAAYEEIAATRLKALIDGEQYDSALDEAESLLGVLPESETALRACINMSQTLMRKDLFYHYAELGYKMYPDNPYFVVKYAIALQEQNRPAEALALLKPREGADPFINAQLSTAYQGVTLDWVNLLLQERLAKKALEMIDSALVHNPNNKELLYSKGLAYEYLKEFDKAYEYQSKNYNPSNAEQSEWYQHMRYLRFRGYRNRLDASYTYAAYDTRLEGLGSVAHMYSVANITYSRLTKKNTYSAGVNYKGVDGYVDGDYYDTGGVGIEVLGQWDHTFNHRWSGMLSGSWSNQYFNRFGANIGASLSLDRGWTPSLKLGYRRTPPTAFNFASNEAIMIRETKEYNLFIVTPAVEKAWERVRTSASVDLSLLRGNLFYNIGWKGKLFINEDNISSVGLMAGFGSFPELTFYDQTVLGNSARTNVSIGFDMQYLLTKNMYVGLSGVWNTFYNPFVFTDTLLKQAYRNVYVLTGQLHVAF